jgi:hypothetical protein
MAYDYATSVQGVRSAWNTLAQTAHRIAAGSVNARKTPPPGAGNGPITGKAKEAASTTAKLDLAEEMLNLNLAKIGVQANTRVISVERELDRSTLDILA